MEIPKEHASNIHCPCVIFASSFYAQPNLFNKQEYTVALPAQGLMKT